MKYALLIIVAIIYLLLEERVISLEERVEKLEAIVENE